MLAQRPGKDWPARHRSRAERAPDKTGEERADTLVRQPGYGSVKTRNHPRR